jgi:hypothetical protein
LGVGAGQADAGHQDGKTQAGAVHHEASRQWELRPSDVLIVGKVQTGVGYT